MKKSLLGLGILMLFVVSCDGKETSSIISNESFLSNESSEIIESIETSEYESSDIIESIEISEIESSEVIESILISEEISSEVFNESIISSEEYISNSETTMEITEDKGNIEYGSLDW